MLPTFFFFFFAFFQLVPVGARLAEMARIRLQYDETRQQVQDIQQVFYHHFHEKFFFIFSSIFLAISHAFLQ